MRSNFGDSTSLSASTAMTKAGKVATANVPRQPTTGTSNAAMPAASRAPTGQPLCTAL